MSIRLEREERLRRQRDLETARRERRRIELQELQQLRQRLQVRLGFLGFIRVKKYANVISRGFQTDLEHQRAMRSNARALVAQRRGSEGGDGQAAVTQAARMVTAFMENSFPNFLEGWIISFNACRLISSCFVHTAGRPNS